MSTTLRQTLLDAIDCVAKGDMDQEKAMSISELARVYIESQRQAIEALRFADSVYPDEGAAIASAAKSIAAGNFLTFEALPQPEAESGATEEETLATAIAQPSQPEKTKAKQPPRAEWKTLIVAALKKSQPLDSRDIARLTKISEQNVYGILKADCFERDENSMYWLAQ